MRYFLILFIFLSLTACSYSPDTLINAYNNLGEDYATELKQMGDLSKEQEQAIDAFAMGIQKWHRNNPLPQHASLITNIANKMKQDQRLTDADLLAFIGILNDYPDFHKANASNHQLALIAKTLSDEQVKQMIESITTDSKDFMEDMQGMSDDKRRREHVRGVNERMKYLGVILTKQQLVIIQTHTGAFHDQRNDFMAATRQWNSTLFALLNNRQKANFVQEFVTHLKSDNEHVQLLQYSPAITKENDQNVVTMLQELLASLSIKQKTQLNNNLLSIGKTLTVLSKQ